MAAVAASSFLHSFFIPATIPHPWLRRSSVPPSHCRCRPIIKAADSRNSGDVESKQVLDAFFLGKAVADAVTERLGTAVGEFLSDVGRWQAEQQRQLRGFQEEVQERARKAKMKAVQDGNNQNDVPENGSVLVDTILSSSKPQNSNQD